MSESRYSWGRVAVPAGCALVGLAALGWRLLARVVVEGPSMLPSLAPGDRLVIWRSPVLEEGDVVALTDPEEPGRVLVKRVERLTAEHVEVTGDNAAASRDSRSFGPVPRRLVLGRALYRYSPPGAAGPITRSR